MGKKSSSRIVKVIGEYVTINATITTENGMLTEEEVRTVATELADRLIAVLSNLPMGISTPISKIRVPVN